MSNPTEPTITHQWARKVEDVLPRHMRRPGEDGYLSPVIENPDHPAHRRNQHRQSGRGSSNQGLQGSGDGTLQTRSSNQEHAAPSEKSHHSHERDRYAPSDDFPKKLHWRQRIKHVTWAYFTLTMATGGIANVLATIPSNYRFKGVDTIGTIFFLLNLVFYVIVWIAIGLRFYLFPHTFRESITHPTESLFAPAAAVSFGTILINIAQYGMSEVGLWLSSAMFVLFWLNAVLAVVLSIAVYLTLWSTQFFSVGKMTPIWIFPAYPMLIVGPYAGNLASRIESQFQKLTIIVGGFTIQGVGFLVAFSIYAAFVYRLMTQKLPQESLRPGMFVSVGPSGFTVAGTITMAANLKSALPKDYMDAGDSQLTAQILQVVANWACLWIWGLALWFFFVSVGAHYSCVRGNMLYAMNWFSFIFPNTALTTATFAIAKAFNSPAIAIVGCVMTCLLVLTWFLVITMMLRAIYLRQILWPQKGEDKDEGGFVAKDVESLSTSTDSGHQQTSSSRNNSSS